MIRRSAFLMLALLLPGCATAPPPLPHDPLAVAHVVALSIPRQQDRSGALNTVAMEATVCTPDPVTPPGYWAHDPHREIAEAFDRARRERARGDTLRAARAVRQAWDFIPRRDDVESRNLLRAQAVGLLVELGRWDDALERASAFEPVPLHENMNDPATLRIRIAYAAARAGEVGVVRRAQAGAPTERMRARVAAAAARGYGARGAFDEARRELASIGEADTLALEEARRGLAVSLADAGGWEEALGFARGAGPPACAGALRLALLGLADGAGQTRIADSLAVEIVARGVPSRQFVDCGELGIWSASQHETIHRLAATGHLAAADSLARMSGEDWGRASGFTWIALAHLGRGDRAEARLSWDRARDTARAVQDSWVAQSGWTMLADTLFAGGWSDAAGEAIAEALRHARTCNEARLRAMALADVARRGPMLARGEDARLLAEAVREARTIADAGAQARALAHVGAAYRDLGIPVAPPERALLAEIVLAHPRWHGTLSE